MNMDDFADSQYAVNDYLHQDSGNEFPHTTRVIVKRNSVVEFDETVSAWARIETNYSHVEINWEKEYLEDKYYSTYRNDYQKIRFDGAFLTVYAKDKQNNDIEIIIA